ncbi:MAG: hypothetical protein EAZ85_15190 [Bacteroidetes bacterium]|nr:MAG: hypothetical protein EAZ85_15190 [Bacteroidota bacterium]TAG95627.1 MAG: hypothetical protein EAZ20_00185 [Bacteroidota bacterium]
MYFICFAHTVAGQVNIETTKFKKNFTQKYDFLNEVFLDLKEDKRGRFFKEVSEYYYEIDKDTLAYYQIQYNLYAKTKEELAKKKYSKKNLVRIFFQKIPVGYISFKNSQEKTYDYPIKEGNTKNLTKKEYEIIIRIKPELEYPTSEISITDGEVTGVEDENDSSHFAIFFENKKSAEIFREKILILNK